MLVIIGLCFLFFVNEISNEFPLIIACGVFDYENSCDVSIADGYYTVGEACDSIAHPFSYSGE